MGLFNSFFGNKEDATNAKKRTISWKPLEELHTLEVIKEKSKLHPIVIFKHSSTCGISAMALRSFEREYDIEEDALTLYFLDLKRYRELSNTVATVFNVQHESPQLLLIKDGVAVYHESHGGIEVGSLKQHL